MAALRITGSPYATLDLTTVAAVKAFMGLSVADTGQDTWLATAITGVSRAAIEYMHRHVLIGERTEEYQIRRSEHVVTLAGAPVNEGQTFEVHVSETRTYGTALPASSYTLNPLIGTLRLRVALPHFKSYVRVKYTAGLAADTAAVLSTYPDLADAVARQIVHLRNRRESLGGGIEMQNAVKVTERGEYTWMKDVRATLDRYRRFAA